MNRRYTSPQSHTRRGTAQEMGKQFSLKEGIGMTLGRWKEADNKSKRLVGVACSRVQEQRTEDCTYPLKPPEDLWRPQNGGLLFDRT